MPNPEKFSNYYLLIILACLASGTAAIPLIGVPAVSAVFYSLALTGFAHWFFGGISNQDTFQTGALKISGAAAVLIGTIYVLDKLLVTQLQDYKQNQNIEVSLEENTRDHNFVVKNRALPVGKLTESSLNEKKYYDINKKSVVQAISVLSIEWYLANSRKLGSSFWWRSNN